MNENNILHLIYERKNMSGLHTGTLICFTVIQKNVYILYITADESIPVVTIYKYFY